MTPNLRCSQEASQLSDMEFSSIPPTTPALENLPSFRIAKIALYASMLFLGVFGNGAVIRVAWRMNWGPMSTSYLLILNLAVCDLATPIFSVPFDLVLEENNYAWPFGAALCKSLWPAATLFTTTASFTLAAISIDRYRLIMHPFTPKLTTKQVRCMIFFCHVLSLLLVVPYALHLELKGTSCEETWSSFDHRKVYTLVLFLAQYGIPLPVMFVMYVLALENLFLSTERVRNSLTRTQPREDGRSASSNACVRERREQNLRVTKMFVSIVVIFAVCTLPNQIFWLWTDFGSGYASPTSNVAGIVCRMFTYANSVFNPVIYATFSREFQAGFRNHVCSIIRVCGCLARLKSPKAKHRVQSGQKYVHSLSTGEATREVPGGTSRGTRYCTQESTNQSIQQEIRERSPSGDKRTACTLWDNQTPNGDIGEAKERTVYQINSFSNAAGIMMVGVHFDSGMLEAARNIRETNC